MASEAKRERPGKDEARGRRFVEIMEHRYEWRQLTGEQIDQVLKMAEEINGWMVQRRGERKA